MKDMLWHEVLFSLRQVSKRPLQTLMIVGILAVGIGANAASFSIAAKVLFQNLPFDPRNRLVEIQYQDSSDRHLSGVSQGDVRDLRIRNHVFDDISLYTEQSGVLRDEYGEESLSGYAVDHYFFATLGVSPMLGRVFDAADERSGAEPVVILGYEAWQRHLRGVADVIGRHVEIDRVRHTVVGVMPPWFHFPETSLPFVRMEAEMWRPLAAEVVSDMQRGERDKEALARLKPGISLDAVNAEIKLVAAGLQSKNSKDSEFRFVATPLNRLSIAQTLPLFQILGVLMLLAALATCINVAGLQVAHAAARMDEIKTRVAIGGTRLQIARLFWVQWALLGIIGCAVGGVFGALGSRLVSLRIPGFRLVKDTTVSWPVLLGMLCVALAVTLLTSFWPAIEATRMRNTERSFTKNPSTWISLQKTRGLLVVGQLTVAMSLITVISLLGVSAYRLLHVNPGFRLDHLVIFTISPSPVEFPSSEARLHHYQQMQEEIGGFPGVEGSALTSVTPLMGLSQSSVQIKDKVVGKSPTVNFADVSPNYFALIGAPLLAGREFKESDGQNSAGVAMVNKTFARDFLGDSEAIGQHICQPPDSGNGGCVWREVVGVVGDMRDSQLRAPAEAAFYLPLAQTSSSTATFCVRTRIAPETMLGLIQQRMAALHPGESLLFATTTKELLRLQTLDKRVLLWVLGMVSMLTLLLTVAGLYGMLATAVERKRKEIGIRMAIGADPWQVAWVFLKQTLHLLSWGLGVGALGAVAAAKVASLSGMLFNVSPYNPLTLLSTAAGLAIVALLATIVPVLRAVNVNPAETLRGE